MDLKTVYLGLELPTPLVVSASPLSQQLDNIKRMEDAGAPAVVMYSLFEEQIVREQHELDHHLFFGTDSFPEALTYFPEPDELLTSGETYLDDIRRAKEAVDIPIIGSLNGSTLGGWTDFASQIQEAGADALELNLYHIETDMEKTSTDVEQMYLDIVTAVKRVVKIPVAVKLSPFFTNMAHMAKQLDVAGANGLVLFNRFYQPDIDLEKLEVVPRVILSSEHELRLPLRWIAILDGRIKASLTATTGVHAAPDVIKLLMAGADVTMMASALLKYGIDHIRHVEKDLRLWMEKHEYHSVQLMQGSMSQIKSADPGAFERAQYVRAVSTLPKDYKIF
ncbi:MAG: dihydroorotate dehydrogenase-like protein [Chloroflexi bacterium]|nr:dihydroorotate dehydrogenase-like protein [Chloroflexota bacterium]